MAPTSITKTFDELVTTTYEKYGHKFVMENVFEGNPLLKFLLAKDRYVATDGGSMILEPVAISKNNTVAAINAYDPINITPQDNATVAKYNYGMYAASVAISDKEKAQNAGECAIIDLLAFKIEMAANSIRDSLSQALYANQDDSDNKSLIGLQKMVADSPTGVAFAGITDTAWDNQAFTLATAGGGASFGTSSQGVKGMRYALKKCTYGADVPDIIVTCEDVHTAYENAIGGTQQTLVPTGLGDLGFQTLQLSGIPVIWDRHIAGTAAANTGRMYFLNTKHLKLRYHPSYNFTLSEGVRAPNTLATYWSIAWLGQLTSNSRRTQAVITTINA